MPVQNKSVGVDLDGVVADIVTQLVRFSRTEYDVHLNPSGFYSENIETCTPIDGEQLKRLFCKPDFFRTMRVMHGARRCIVQLGEHGHDIHVVTDRFWYPEIQDDTRRWLASRGMRVNSLTFAHKAAKQSVARDLKIDWFIEDQRSNANLLSEVCQVFLIDRPYNQGILAANVVRVETLAQAVDSILNNLGQSRLIPLRVSRKPGLDPATSKAH